MTTERIYNLTGFSVAVEIVRACGEVVCEEMLCETNTVSAAIVNAIDACVAAYPGAKQIRWLDTTPMDNAARYVSGRGPVFGIWFGC